MRRTARRVLGTGSITVLLALTVAVAAASAAADGIVQPAPRPAVSPLVSVEPMERPPASQGLSVRGAVELIALALTCSAVVAFYSATSGGWGGTRVPARVRRR